MRDPTRYPSSGYVTMARNRTKIMGRRESGTFTAIPHAVQDGANWRQCSGTAIKLLCTIARQYNGRNNGDLCAALSVLRPHGFTSPDTVSWALRELRYYGLILLTRQGGLNGPSLYAVSWQSIDECGGKLTCAKPSPVASGDWKTLREPFKRPRKKQNASTPSVVDRYAIRSSESKKAA